MTVTTLQRWPDAHGSVLERAREGSDDAFAEIVESHQRMVYGICLGGLRDRSRAEETAQEVFLQLYRNLDRIESEGHLTNWLRRTATHRVIDASRVNDVDSISLDRVREPAAPGHRGDPLLRDRLRMLVHELPVMQRMTVVLRFGEEMKLSEIAETLEMPINSVKSNLRRGVARLREALSAEGMVS